MKKQKIQIIFKKIRHSFSNIGSDADKDWRIIFAIFGLLFFVSVIWHTKIYVEMSSAIKSPYFTMPSGGAPINEAMFDAIYAKYTKRSEESVVIISRKHSLVDPAR